MIPRHGPRRRRRPGQRPGRRGAVPAATRTDRGPAYRTLPRPRRAPAARRILLGWFFSSSARGTGSIGRYRRPRSACARSLPRICVKASVSRDASCASECPWRSGLGGSRPGSLSKNLNAASPSSLCLWAASTSGSHRPASAAKSAAVALVWGPRVTWYEETPG